MIKNKNNEKKLRKSLWVKKIAVSLHRQNQNGWFWWKIGLWCNGNTTDSGPVFPGSSPGSPTKKRRFKRTSSF